jgi:hypothetical protein
VCKEKNDVIDITADPGFGPFSVGFCCHFGSKSAYYFACDNCSVSCAFSFLLLFTVVVIATGTLPLVPWLVASCSYSCSAAYTSLVVLCTGGSTLRCPVTSPPLETVLAIVSNTVL